MAAENLSSPFNRLILEKAALERSSAVQTLECFPFTENIGSTEDQLGFVRNCLQGLRTLKAALAEVPDADYHTVGISTRFLRTGGFQIILIPWNVDKEELVQFLRSNPPEAERTRFLGRISSLKKTIAENLWAGPLYCSLRISNDQCLQGYETLATAKSADLSGQVQWREVMVAADSLAEKDPYTLALGYDIPMAEMLAQLQVSPHEQWAGRKRMYEKLEALYKTPLEDRLHVVNLFCQESLSESECLEGAENLYQASVNEVLQDRVWGKVVIHKHNTIIQDDHSVMIRHDLPAAGIIEYFSRGNTVSEATEYRVRSEKLEGIAKNNPAGLRPVCDLGGLSSALCLKGLETFVGFVSGHREFRAGSAWTEVMFVDGRQLPRVNFALNSKMRGSYIYVDADSDPVEFGAFIGNFSETSAGSENP